MKFVLLAAAVLPMLGGGTSIAHAASQRLTNNDVCNTYAEDAIRDIQLALYAHCTGITGARWDQRQSAHFNFCMQNMSRGNSAVVQSEKDVRHGIAVQCAAANHTKYYPSGPGSGVAY